ncbi:MAG: hypothetical protein ACLSSV_00500 [Veillonella parvula]|uniref:hypothetical protein n=1 Tax=Veillonella parvula TaxID=29466 RepID=UPI0039915CC5
MASIYPNTRLTNYGRELIARSQATGKKLQYIKLVTGDGQLNNQNIDTMTSVIAPKLECPFTSNGEFVGDGQFRIEFAVGNSTVTNGFFARELGVYANLEGESDSAAKLIAYSNGGNYASYIPSKETPINSKAFSLDVVIGNSTNVTVKKIDAAYLTRGALDAHNRDTSAHTPITDQIKAILGSDNWKDSPASTLVTIKNLLGQGAIVASKLDANAGFVKFANGFTIQWGISWFDSNRYYKDISLPINSTVLVSLATDDSVSVATSGSECFISWNSGFSQSNRTAIRFLTNRADTGSFVWIAVGLS